jgi:Ser/Thr protein kinase RdoA (MazF antagonist)
MISDETIRELLHRDWGLAGGTRVARHDGGMGSQTWIVDQGERRWVAKSVAPHLAESFAHGLRVAQLLGEAGISAGAPVPALAGPVTVDAVSGDRLALLTWVPGSPLAGAGEGEQRLIGDTLARVHRVLRGQVVPGAQRFHWVDPAASHLGLRPWVRPAVSAAVDALAALQRRKPTWPQGLLHADPAPEAFRHDAATGHCGIIDWSSAHHGPLLYDLASAVMYLGGPGRAAAMTDAYLSAGVLTAREAADGLPVMLRFRWAVQADYFAWRITANDLTGITGPEENEKGLEDARRALLLGDGTT